MYTWKAPPSLTIYDLADMKKDFNTDDLMEHDCIVDLSDVKDIDSAGVQFLMAISQRSQTVSRICSFQGGDDNVMELLHLFGLTLDLVSQTEVGDV
ncbi:STAS domain-containing protein [Nitrincola nitratireducens]|uniref:Putative NTP binding protein (Contains STAS domain) n=1 Tax=Nitrincola nitratireducens TaxID=1229521 RepID=W9V5M7_9GAMM|nr:STAS domain-containing protein [Nitrincola nitratireducens]EXJ12236.1 putative NTP binding protein (contains STAS domain) [Nitrincola nitratireducens]